MYVKSVCVKSMFVCVCVCVCVCLCKRARTCVLACAQGLESRLLKFTSKELLFYPLICLGDERVCNISYLLDLL